MKRFPFFQAAAVILILLFAVSGCTRFSASAPEGFAELKERRPGKYQAVSPEGVRFGVRRVRNYPKKEVSFWEKAVENYMLEAGYTLVEGPESFSAGRWEGALFTWGAPYRGEDYLYTLAVVPARRSIILIESAGAFDVYKKYSDELTETIKNIKIR